MNPSAPKHNRARDLDRRAGGWVHRETRNRVLFSAKAAPWHLFESAQPVNRHGTELLWVAERDDEDFGGVV